MNSIRKSTGTDLMVDQYWDYVSLLLKFDSTSGQPFIDCSKNMLSFANNGTTAISTSITLPTSAFPSGNNS
jgi:hypothetical protein